jgi:hypothetical protein
MLDDLKKVALMLKTWMPAAEKAMVLQLHSNV